MPNKDQVEGRGKEMGGKIQEGFGKLTHNRSQQIKGTIRKNVGAGQAKLGDLEERTKERAQDRDEEKEEKREVDGGEHDSTRRR